jgi:hypothetical protein
MRPILGMIKQDAQTHDEGDLHNTAVHLDDS